MEAGDDMDPPGHEVVISIDDLTSDSPGTSSLNPGDRLVSQSDAETAGRGALPAGKTATCSWFSLETAFTLTGEGSGLDEAALSALQQRRFAPMLLRAQGELDALWSRRGYRVVLTTPCETAGND